MAFFAYSDNYLIAVKFGVIVDVEASRSIRQAKIGLMQKKGALFDHVTGVRQHSRRHVKANRLGTFEIDHKLTSAVVDPLIRSLAIARAG
jgi:hypothetical protein